MPSQEHLISWFCAVAALLLKFCWWRLVAIPKEQKTEVIRLHALYADTGSILCIMVIFLILKMYFFFWAIAIGMYMAFIWPIIKITFFTNRNPPENAPPNDT